MKLHNLTQGSDPWRRWRFEGIGGSDVAAILGLSPFQDATRSRLLEEKIHRRERETNFAMRRGNRLEPTARAIYERKRLCTAPPVCVEHDQCSWMRVSLDGLCRQKHFDRKGWILELKCANWQVHSMALAGEVPEYYRVQCQWQLLVSGLDFCEFMNYSQHERFAESDRVALIVIDADAEEQARIHEEAEKFWNEVLLGRERLAEATKGNTRFAAEVI